MKELEKRAAGLLNEDIFVKNVAAIRQYNLQFFKLFNLMALAFMVLLFASTFVSPYALSLQTVYLVFIALITVEEAIVYFYPPKGTAWVTPLCYLGMLQIYSFCILSGVIYNVNDVAINYHVFLILIPLSILLPFKNLLAVQSFSLLAFVVTTFMYKATTLARIDSISALIYFAMGLFITSYLNKMRVEYLGLYQEHDESERQKILLLNETPVGIMKLGIDANNAVDVLYINDPCIEMLGYTKEAFYAIENWSFGAVAHPEDVHLIEEAMVNPTVGKSDSFEFRLWHHESQSYYWIACKFKIIEVKDGYSTVLCNYLDIDSQRRVADASKAKSAFLSRMSHEIRTPINAIMGMAELGRQDISSGDVDKTAILNYFDETTAASKYLLTLVNDVLDTSRIENNKVELQPVVVNAQEFLANIATIIEPLAEKKGVQLISERKTFTKECFFGDPVRVKQILLNILNNAIKFTPQGGSVYFSAEAVAQSESVTRLRFIVRDTGIGMTKEFQENLFTPFSQENGAISSPFEGTGLGLSIAKALVQKMNGDIVCESTKGEGTTFTITLEVGNVDASMQKAAEAKTEVDAAADFSGVHILLCEDHPLNQKIAKTLLERRQCIVDVANDGAEGLKLFKASAVGTYDLILMDIRMPVMDGLQTTKEIRGLDRADALTVPIVAMSANAYAEDVQKSLAAGMNDHLAKPVEPQKLFQVIGTYTGTPAAAVPQEKKTILLVDDVEMTLAIMQKTLLPEYNVLVAHNGKEALEVLAQSGEVDLVITDLQMPEMDGEELITTMRKLHRYDHIAIIVNTMYGEPKREEKLLAMGADDFVYKTVTPKILTTRVRYVLARYQQFYKYRK